MTRLILFAKVNIALYYICSISLFSTAALVPNSHHRHRVNNNVPTSTSANHVSSIIINRRSTYPLSTTSSLFQASDGNDLFTKVKETSLLDEVNDALMKLNDKANASISIVKGSDNTPSSKLTNLLKFLLYRTSFLLYRVYRGFFVLVPALIYSIIKEIRGGETSDQTYQAPNWFQKNFLLKTHTSWGKAMRERVVRRYFEGVSKKDAGTISSCFAEEARIRDVCNLSGNSKLVRVVTPADLTERCIEFVTAHPDCNVDFYYPPRCGRSASRWVFAHWFETGTWSGISCGVNPEGTPLEVEGQTRFYVNDDCLIEELVVTRTFTGWEKQLFAARNS